LYRLDQKATRQGSAVLRDTAVMGATITRLANARVQPEVGASSPSYSGGLANCDVCW
jgi:hypothetical protein